MYKRQAEELQITQEDTGEFLPLKNFYQGFQQNPRKRSGAIWSDERRVETYGRWGREWRRWEELVEPNEVHSGSYEKKTVDSECENKYL